MPTDAIALMAGNRDTVLMRPMPRDADAVRLLAFYADIIRRLPAGEKPELRQLVATHVRELMMLALGGMHATAEHACDRSLRAARLRAIKADIGRNLFRSNLTVAEIAARHQVTPRYVQMLFEFDGITFTEFMLGERLARAHCMLSDPRLADRSVAAVAFDTGFGDLSYFNRTFRRRFGCTPSQARAAARGAWHSPTSVA